MPSCSDLRPAAPASCLPRYGPCATSNRSVWQAVGQPGRGSAVWSSEPMPVSSSSCRSTEARIVAAVVFNLRAIITKLGIDGTTRPTSIDERNARLNGSPRAACDKPSPRRRRRTSLPKALAKTVPAPASDCLRIVDIRTAGLYVERGVRAWAPKGARHGQAGGQEVPFRHPRDVLGGHSTTRRRHIGPCLKWRCVLPIGRRSSRK